MKAESGGAEVESANNANGLVRPKNQQQLKGRIEEQQRMEREGGPSEGGGVVLKKEPWAGTEVKNIGTLNFYAENVVLKTYKMKMMKVQKDGSPKV